MNTKFKDDNVVFFDKDNNLLGGRGSDYEHLNSVRALKECFEIYQNSNYEIFPCDDPTITIEEIFALVKNYTGKDYPRQNQISEIIRDLETWFNVMLSALPYEVQENN